MKISEIFDIKKGKKVEEIKHKDNAKRLRYIQIEDLRHDNNIKYTAMIDKAIIANEDDVIIAWDGAHAGTIGFGLSGAVGSTLAILRPKVTGIHIPYVGIYLQTKSKYLRDNCSGATIPHIQKQVLNNIDVPIVPYEEQKRIAEVLLKARYLINKRTEAIEMIEEFVQAIFLEIFGDPFLNENGWDICNLDELIVSGPQNGIYKSSDHYGRGTPIIRIDSFYNGRLLEKGNFKRVFLTSTEISQYKVSVNDILVNRVNSRPYLGKCALVDDLQEDTVFESNMMKFSLDTEKVDPDYFVTIFMHDFIRGQILKSAKDAVNQSSINQTDVRSFYIPIPPINLQEKFSRIRKKCHEQKEIMELSLLNLEQYYQSLLQSLFKGKVSEIAET